MNRNGMYNTYRLGVALRNLHHAILGKYYDHKPGLIDAIEHTRINGEIAAAKFEAAVVSAQLEVLKRFTPPSPHAAIVSLASVLLKRRGPLPKNPRMRLNMLYAVIGDITVMPWETVEGWPYSRREMERVWFNK